MSTKADRDQIELLQGTLDLLILRTPRSGPAHGHTIAKAIEHGSEDVLQVEQGSLYPAGHRSRHRFLQNRAGLSRIRASCYYRGTAGEDYLRTPASG
jgi:DNA-binding PadR family transcriptional regulator